MIPVVNNKHRYMLFYSAKAASTSSRKLYLQLHEDEFAPQEREQLSHYHNLNSLHGYDADSDYSDYIKFLITRNPYSRVVSAYLDQYVYARNQRVENMIAENPPSGSMPDSFIEFLEYLKDVPDAERDPHFQTQVSFAQVRKVVVRPNLFRRCFFWLRQFGNPERYRVLELDKTSDIRNFKKFMQSIYADVFKSNPAMLKKALAKIDEIKKSNSSFYGHQDFEDAGSLSVAELEKLTLSPKPQDFYRSVRAQQLVEEIYAEDFKLFGYEIGDLPMKKASPEVDLIPDDFDWQAYVDVNLELSSEGIDDERTAIRHYLEFGRFEHRAYSRVAPSDFDWRRYLELHADLPAAGILNEEDAINHYLSFGMREGRQI